jgi:isopenicillin-N N-acyltransferase-like protein
MPAISLNDAASGEHFFYEWRGNPYEIGVQHGSALRREIIADYSPALHDLAHDTHCSESEILKRYTELYEPLFEQYVPRALEEIRGLAEGCGIEYQHAFFAATRDGLSLPCEAPSAEGCSSFYCGPATTQNGEVFIGQTKDTTAPLSRYRIMKIVYEDTGKSEIRLNYPGWIASIGLNSSGVATTGNSMYAPPSPHPTVPYSLARRIVLDSNSTREAIAVLEKFSLRNCCFLVADGSGHGVCLEYIAGDREIYDISHRAFGHANAILASRLKHLDASETDTRTSKFRQKNLQARLDEKNGVLDAGMLETILADHEDYPLSICRHTSSRDISTTTAAFIADLVNKEIRIAIGNPCTAPFQTYRI